MIQIKRPEECCGCTACAEKCPKRCISMQPDAEGFLYPVVDASLCIECGLCEKVCPVLHRYGAPEPASVRAYACCNRDEPVRMASSSGGVFSLLSGEVLDKGGVVFGARFDHDFSVVHDSVEEIAGLGTLRGSKYTQSRIEGSFRRAESLLKAGREVLFGSTTCDRTLPACAPGISEQGGARLGTLLHRVGICPYERRRVTAIAIGGTLHP